MRRLKSASWQRELFAKSVQILMVDIVMARNVMAGTAGTLVDLTGGPMAR